MQYRVHWCHLSATIILNVILDNTVCVDLHFSMNSNYFTIFSHHWDESNWSITFFDRSFSHIPFPCRIKVHSVLPTSVYSSHDTVYFWCSYYKCKCAFCYVIMYSRLSWNYNLLFYCQTNGGSLFSVHTLVGSMRLMISSFATSCSNNILVNTELNITE